MNLLAIDTTTEACTVGLAINNTIYETTEITPKGHSTLVLGMLDTLFAQANATLNDIQAIAFGRGPGSFTGVRVGVGVTQGIAFAKNLPVIPISSLAAVAQQAFMLTGETRIAVANDARMAEVYAAFFEVDSGHAQLVSEERVCPPDAFQAEQAGSWFAAGTGWAAYESVLNQNFADRLTGIDAEILPTARAILTLAQYQTPIPATQALPVYLRNNVAIKKGHKDGG